MCHHKKTEKFIAKHSVNGQINSSIIAIKLNKLHRKMDEIANLAKILDNAQSDCTYREPSLSVLHRSIDELVALCTK